MQRFQQRTVLITGAASGIGRAAARRFAEEGAALVLVDRNEEGLEETRAALPAGTEVMTRALDVSDENAVDALVETVIAERGRIHALCNNAGIAGGDYSGITETDTDTWRAILNVNLLGPVFFTRAVGRHMREQAAAPSSTPPRWRAFVPVPAATPTAPPRRR